MIVNQDDRRRRQLQRPLDDLARIDGRVVDGAARLLLVGDERVLAVEEQHAERFVRRPRHGRGAVIDERGPGAQGGPVQQLRAGEPERRRLDDLELRDHALARALDLQDALARGRKHLREGAETADQRLGERLEVAPRDGGEQDQLQKLVIGQRVGAAFQEAAAQALAMLEIVRLLELPRGLLGLGSLLRGSGLAHAAGFITLRRLRRAT